MKTRKGVLRTVVAILILGSCAKNNDVLNSTDVQNINSESVSDSYTSETADMGNTVVGNLTNTQYANGGREEGTIAGLDAIDTRLTGATITIAQGANSTADVPQGTITIDFGQGQTDPAGVMRRGQISIAYSGRKFVQGSTRVISYSKYSRNRVLFDSAMTFTITNIKDSTQFHHVLTGGKLTFPDYSVITRNTDFNVTVDYVAKTVTISPNIAAPNSANGTTRSGTDYTMTITTGMVYKASCLATKIFIPVSGEKTITAGSASYKVNYGDGTCDNTITISAGGRTATLTVNSDGN